MYKIYCYALAIGIIALLISIILDGISDIFQGLTFFDCHFDVMPGILPLSPLQICAFLGGFGGMGMTLYTRTHLHWLFAILVGYSLSFLTHLIIAKLKQINSSTITEQDILGMEGKVVVTIFENGVGSVSFDTDTGKITYSAKSDHYIPQGTTVKAIDIQNAIVTVTDSPSYFLKSSL